MYVLISFVLIWQTTIIDETFETLTKESLARNGEWIIGFGKVNVRESLKKWKCEKGDDAICEDIGGGIEIIEIIDINEDKENYIDS
ncbi:hypothetical protein RhiirA4_404377 [Rhizophagus irregularis]|uniref:Uncharacterized protein n=1 Tax=Rhizophagus irregularis TaxID=588596 RepID=A0A2I1GP67_9GLOM|nr:hypothetical protein RhiirA4_404377 [Rhizophagus irregularis]